MADRAQVNALMARLADGDRSAVAPAFDLLWPVLQRFCRRALASDADGEDAAQEAIVKLFARAASFDPGRDGLAWALAIASWECRTVRRRAGRRREAPLDAAAEMAADGDTEATVAARELAAAAREALAELDPGDAATVMAALSEEPGARPAAVAPATFRKRLERALGRLRGLWSKKHGAI
ncbi:MAG TPA: sigma factor [Kofleriaceae bacterium]|nr:sigma factor [Kofleriaceae bacterium]